MKNTLSNYVAAAAIAAAFLFLGAVLDVPSDGEVAAAVAADLSDAQAQARAEFKAQTHAAMEAQP